MGFAAICRSKSTQRGIFCRCTCRSAPIGARILCGASPSAQRIAGSCCAACSQSRDKQQSKPPRSSCFAERRRRRVAATKLKMQFSCYFLVEAFSKTRSETSEPTQPFRFKALGQLCSIGGYQAVAEMFGVRVSGFLAWFLWRGVYLLKLPTWSRRIKVAFDWAWDVVFPRDLGFLSTDAAQRFTHSYYRAGDFIQRQGEPPRFF